MLYKYDVYNIYKRDNSANEILYYHNNELIGSAFQSKMHYFLKTPWKCF